MSRRKRKKASKQQSTKKLLSRLPNDVGRQAVQAYGVRVEGIEGVKAVTPVKIKIGAVRKEIKKIEVKLIGGNEIGPCMRNSIGSSRSDINTLKSKLIGKSENGNLLKVEIPRNMKDLKAINPQQRAIKGGIKTDPGVIDPNKMEF